MVQIVKRVSAFLAEVVPAADDEDETRRRRLFMAEQVAAERMADMWAGLHQAWCDSKGIVATSKTVYGGPVPVKTELRRISQGDPKYLNAAFRLARETGKMPLAMFEQAVDAEDEELALEIEKVADDVEAVAMFLAKSAEEAAANADASSNSNNTHPPIEDCSETTVEEAVTTTADEKTEFVTPEARAVWEAEVAEVDRRKAEIFKTVQHDPELLATFKKMEQDFACFEPRRDRPETGEERKRREKLAVMKLRELQARKTG